MKEIVAVFNYNGVEYVIYNDSNKLIPCKHVNRKIVQDLTKEEKKMFDDVFKKLKVSDNKIKLSNIFFNDKEYEHYYDKENGWSTFLNVDGSQISKKELHELNNAFNYQDNIMYSVENNFDKHDFIKRIVKYGKESIVVFLASSLLLSSASGLSYVGGEEHTNDLDDIVAVDIEPTMHVLPTNPIDQSYFEIERESIDKVHLLRNIIDSNSDLSDEDKSIIYDFLPIINENIDYIDFDYVANIFSNLKVFHIEYGGEPLGLYAEGVIDLYHSKDNAKEGEKPIYYEELMEELAHALQMAVNNQGLYESVAKDIIHKDLMPNEYTRAYYEILKNLIGEKPLKEFFCQGKIESITNALLSILNDERYVYTILTEMTSLYREEQHAVNSADLQSLCSMYSTAEYGIEYTLGLFYEKQGKSMYVENFDIINKIHNLEGLSDISEESIKEKVKEDFNNKRKIVSLGDEFSIELSKDSGVYRKGIDLGTIKVYRSNVNGEDRLIINIKGMEPIMLTNNIDAVLYVLTSSNNDTINISLNGKFLTLHNTDTRHIITINLETREQASIEDLLAYSNLPASEYYDLLYKEITSYYATLPNDGMVHAVPENIGKGDYNENSFNGLYAKDDKYGLDENGNIISYICYEVKNEDGSPAKGEDILLARVNPNDPNLRYMNTPLSGTVNGR